MNNPKGTTADVTPLYEDVKEMKHMDWTPKTRNRLNMQLQLLLMVILHLKMIRKTQLLPI